jgi:hypothetical protein
MSKIRVLLYVMVIAGLPVHPAWSAPPAAATAQHAEDNDKALDLHMVNWAALDKFAKLYHKLHNNGDATIDKKLDENGELTIEVDLKGALKSPALDAEELNAVLTPAEFKEADLDHDGKLTTKEYLALAEKLFEQADADHDGTVDAEELTSPAGEKLLRLLDPAP